MTDKDDFGFGDMVTVELRGYEIDGEVVAAGPDNRDLEDDQYVIAVSADDEMAHDGLSSEEIIRENQVVDARRP